MAVVDDEMSALLSEHNKADEDPGELFKDVSAVLSESIEAGEKTVEISPHDIAWADSCLEFGPELSEDRWTSMKEAFLDALNYPTSYETTSTSDAKKTEDDGKKMDVEYDPEDHEPEPTIIHAEEGILTKEVIEESDLAKEVIKEGKQQLNGPISSQEDVESRDNIFKVWDLEALSPEEDDDELIQQLKKLMSESSLNDPSHNSNSVLNEESIDELILNLTDLSLEPLMVEDAE